MKSDKKSAYDVIIAGAGPVGLLLACELALAKCSVLIIERTLSPHSALKRVPFGIRGLSAPTNEALDRRGLLSELELHKHMKNPHQNAGVGLRRQVGHFAGIPLYDGDIDTSQWTYRLPSSTPSSLISEIEELETLLARRAQSLGVEIKRGFAVTNFQQTESEVVVQTAEQSLTGKWLVGCDGSRSVVRKTSGIEFDGTEPEFTGYTTQIEIVDPQKLKSGRNLTAEGMYIQSQPGYVIIQDFDGGAFHDAEKPITLEHVQTVLRRVSDTDVTISALHVATTWTDRSRQARSYRKGRVFLAGDAAHIHSPLGGQGLNLGLGDAMNLGWKLAAAIHERAPGGLLDSYQSERYPVGAQVLDWSRAQVAIMKVDPAARALNAVIHDLISTRDGATYVAGRVWGISTRYDLGSEHPLVGRSVPNFEFDDATKIAEFMRGGQGILLDFTKSASLKYLAGEYGDRVRYVSRASSERLGLSAAVIRPDGIVGWACDGEAETKPVREALGRWFI